MRFSLLTVNLSGVAGRDVNSAVEPLARFVAEQNVSCVCLQGCVAHGAAGPSAGQSDVAENTSLAGAEALGRLGLKYDSVWTASHADTAGGHRGPAVLTQLPIIGSASGVVSHSDEPGGVDSRATVGARLGISPEVNIDVYSVHLAETGEGAAQIEILLRFVRDSVDIFVPPAPPTPRRRGRPPRVAVTDPRPEPVRMVFLAGGFTEPAGRDADEALRQSGYVCSSPQPSTDRDVAVRPERSADGVYLRPGIKPTVASWVSPVGDLPGASPGLLLAYEV